MPTGARPLIAVSSCLLGRLVRYDGGHKRHAWIVEELGKHVDFLPICPEEGIGMGTPREPIQLIGSPERPRAIGVNDPSVDVTSRLEAFALNSISRMERVSGYILKSKSPSCGISGVKLLGADGGLSRNGIGIHALTIMAALPDLPIVDEERLEDFAQRESFVNQVLAYHRRLGACRI